MRAPRRASAQRQCARAVRVPSRTLCWAPAVLSTRTGQAQVVDVTAKRGHYYAHLHYNQMISYGMRSRRTHSLEDQLDRADAVWKLAKYGRPLRHGELSCPWRSCRRFPSSLRRRAVAGPPTVRFSTTGVNMVCRTKERALDPLLVPVLLALATPSIC